MGQQSLSLPLKSASSFSGGQKSSPFSPISSFLFLGEKRDVSSPVLLLFLLLRKTEKFWGLFGGLLFLFPTVVKGGRGRRRRDCVGNELTRNREGERERETEKIPLNHLPSPPNKVEVRRKRAKETVATTCIFTPIFSSNLEERKKKCISQIFRRIIWQKAPPSEERRDENPNGFAGRCE